MWNHWQYKSLFALIMAEIMTYRMSYKLYRIYFKWSHCMNLYYIIKKSSLKNITILNRYRFHIKRLKYSSIFQNRYWEKKRKNMSQHLKTMQLPIVRPHYIMAYPCPFHINKNGLRNILSCECNTVSTPYKIIKRCHLMLSHGLTSWISF